MFFKNFSVGMEDECKGGCTMPDRKMEVKGHSGINGDRLTGPEDTGFVCVVYRKLHEDIMVNKVKEVKT